MTVRRAGAYFLHEEVGRGAMGVVYRATHSQFGWVRAIKEPILRGASDSDVARFVEEARLEGLMQHPNIATVFELVVDDGTPYIVMEYFGLGSVRAVVPILTEPQQLLLLAEVLDGLGHAHAHDVVHRDLKAENLMRTDEGHVKIADFGIAKALGDLALPGALTEAGWFVGDPRYVAPEIVRSVGPDARADLYSVGILAYELFTGYVPFHELPAGQIVEQKLTHAVPSVRRARPDLDKELTQWCDSLLHRDRSRRPESAGEALESLHAIADRILESGWQRRSRLPQTTDLAAGVNREIPRHRLATPAQLRAIAPLPVLARSAAASRGSVVVLAVVGGLAALVTSAGWASRPLLVIAGALVTYVGVFLATFLDPVAATVVARRRAASEVVGADQRPEPAD